MSQEVSKVSVCLMKSKEVPEGLKTSQEVLGGLRRSQKISGGHRRSHEVSKGLRRFQKVSGVEVFKSRFERSTTNTVLFSTPFQRRLCFVLTALESFEEITDEN